MVQGTPAAVSAAREAIAAAIADELTKGDDEARAKALHLIENKLPYTVTLDVVGAKIGALLGYRGENIRGIEARSWATVSVPREGAMRTVVICGPTQESIDLALLDVEGALQAKAPRRT